MYQRIRNVSFSENFAYLLDEWSLSILNSWNLSSVSSFQVTYLQLICSLTKSKATCNEDLYNIDQYHTESKQQKIEKEEKNSID